MGERRDKAIKELKEQLAEKYDKSVDAEKQNFWETSGFKVIASMSMLILVVFAKGWSHPMNHLLDSLLKKKKKKDLQFFLWLI